MNSNNYLFTNDDVSSSRIIYTPSSFARSSLFYLQETGTLQAIRPHVSSRANLQSYLFLIVLDGEGWLEYNGAHYDLSKGCAAFIDCRKGYRQSSGERLWQLKWCHFHSGNMSAVYNKWTERGGKPVFRPADSATFVDVLDRLYAAAASEDFVRDMHINEQLVRLTTLLMEQTVYEERRVYKERRAYKGKGQHRERSGLPDKGECRGRSRSQNEGRRWEESCLQDDGQGWERSGARKDGQALSSAAAGAGRVDVEVSAASKVDAEVPGVSRVDAEVPGVSRANVEAVKSYIDDHYKEKLSLEGVAALYYVNKSYLARVFKETYGVTVGNYIQLVRIGKAKELLRFSGKTVEQISYECGYGGDSNFFSRVFKKVEGCSPREFRKIWISEYSAENSS